MLITASQHFAVRSAPRHPLSSLLCLKSQVNSKNIAVTADPCTIEEIGYLLSPSYSGSSLAALAGQAPLDHRPDLQVSFFEEQRHAIGCHVACIACIFMRYVPCMPSCDVCDDLLLGRRCCLVAGEHMVRMCAVDPTTTCRADVSTWIEDLQA